MICLQKLRDVLVCENNFQGTLFCVRVVWCAFISVCI